MASFFQNLQDKFRQIINSEFFTRKNILTLLLLFIIGLSFYPGIKLIQDSQIFKSGADEDLPECSEIENECTEDNWGERIDCKIGNSCQFIECGNEETEEEVCDENGENCYLRYSWNNPVSKTCSAPPVSPPPGASPSTPPASTAPGTCSIDSKQSPNVGDACATCISTNNPTLLGSIRSAISDSQCSSSQKSSKTDTQLINYWCNGGTGTGGSSDCLTKKALCGTSCGYPALITPAPSAAGGSPAPSPTPSPTSFPATVKPNPPSAVTALSCTEGLIRLTWTGIPATGVTYLVRGLKTTDANFVPTITWTNGHSLTTDIIGNSSNENGEASCANTTSCSASVEYPTAGTYKVWVAARTSQGTSDNAFVPGLVTCSNFTPRSPAPSSSPSSPTSSCDFNSDGKYDDSDFKIWVDEFTGQKTSLRADCNTDLKVDLVDFNLWRNEKINRE